MATFIYEAVDSSNKTISGRVEAESEQLLLTKLHEQRFHVVSIKEAGAGTRAAVAAKTGSVKLQSLVIFSRQFATMIDAGIGIVKCLDILETQCKEDTLRAIVGQVRRDVKDGLSLTDSIIKHPRCFTKLYVNMIKAAEIGGILDKILDRLAGFLEKEMEINQKVKSAMMYPCIVLVFAMLIVVALFVVVLPKFKEIFVSMGVEMPPVTQALFDMSDFVCKWWYVFIVATVAGVVAFKQYKKTEAGLLVIDRLKLKVPIFGELSLKISVSRFARTFGTLISSGVPMMRSLEIIGETSGNSVIAQAVGNARNAIREGARISVPLTQCGLFPTMVTHMIDVGEETGRLSEMLVKVADFYDSEVESMIKGLTSMIEPLLICFMGVLVGFIAIAVMSPIFKLVSSIH